MSKTIQTYVRLCDVLERCLYWIIVTIVSAMTVVVALQIMARYFMSVPWVWTIDIAIFCLVWSTFLVSASAVRRNAHFVIDLWPENWRGWLRILGVLSVLAILIVSFFLLKEGWHFAEAGTRRMAGMTGIKMSYFLASIPAGAVFMILFAIEQLLKSFKTQG